MMKLAQLNHAKACQLAAKLERTPGLRIINHSFFNELTVDVGRPAAALVEKLAAHNILAGVPVSRLYPGIAEFENLLLITATELTSEADMDKLTAALGSC